MPEEMLTVPQIVALIEEKTGVTKAKTTIPGWIRQGRIDGRPTTNGHGTHWLGTKSSVLEAIEDIKQNKTPPTDRYGRQSPIRHRTSPKMKATNEAPVQPNERLTNAELYALVYKTDGDPELKNANRIFRQELEYRGK